MTKSKADKTREDAAKTNQTRAGVIGATGYAGLELVRLLLSHPQVELAAVSSVSFTGQRLDSVYPQLLGFCDLVLGEEDDVIAQCEVVFASLPAGLSEPLARRCVDEGKVFIDMGADFRLHNEKDYQEWYGGQYGDKELHRMAIYSIPELHGERLRGGRKALVANPGCYPTSIALGLAPALQGNALHMDTLIIDSKSGATGAGRGLSLNTHYPECNEAFGPYKVAAHRHTPEIEQVLTELCGAPVQVSFTPHLLPINRGILSTMYAKLQADWDIERLARVYHDKYDTSDFVRVLPLGETANVKNVLYSNLCHVSLHVDKRTGRCIIVSAIDNMVKGAAGQAIQNMNLILGLPETVGLNQIPRAF